MTDPDDTQGNSKSQAKTLVSSTDGPAIKFPPFPIQPNAGEGASIIPFKHFKEHGIRIFSNTGVEMDGLGIPTVELAVVHDLDVCKTETRRKLKGGKNESEGKRGKIATAAPVGEAVKLNPMEKAKDRRTQRFLLFAKKEWFDQWSEGEHLRGLKIYDPNLSSITRIHQASTDFRTGRIWPPAHTQLMYLWDQFRLYAGLLGTTPIWTRTDLPQPEEVNDEDEVEEGPTSSALPRPKRGSNLDAEMELASDFDDDDDDEFNADNSQTRPANESEQYPQRPLQPPRKRFPLRTPYELYNKDPILVSSDAEVHALLARAAVEKETKLLAFLSDPEKSIKIFLSSYMRKEGLIWTPSFLTYLPILLTFFLSFLIRANVIPECERQLKRALETAQEAAIQLPCTGRLCRILPDAMGKGAKGCWGTKWEEKWDFGLTKKTDSKPTEEALPEEALKMFEDEVKKANLQLLSKETMFGPEPVAPISVDTQQSDDEQISIQIMSPTSPGPKTPTALVNQLIPETTTTSSKDTAHTLETPNWALAPDTSALPDSPPPSPPAQFSTTTVLGSALPPSNLKRKEENTQISDDESEDSEEDPRSWASPTGRPPTRSQKLAEKAPWFSPPIQPLMKIFGLTTLPLRYESGIAERSLRKVTSVLKPGEGGGKWRGVEEELVKRLARVVLEPWLDWGGENVAPGFMTPTLVGGDMLSSLNSTKAKEGGENGKPTHDPLKDDITILVEPSVTNSLNVGMGMAGTWVQMVPLRSDNFGGGRGRGRGDNGSSRGGGARAGRKEQKFWYVEELSLAIPSFWTVGEEVKEIEADEDDIANFGRRYGSKKY